MAAAPVSATLRVATHDDLFDRRYPRAAAVVAGHDAPAVKLAQLCDILIFEPWAEPMAACADLPADQEAAHAARHSALFAAVLGDGDGTPSRAEVFLLAAEGLQADAPPLDILRARVADLITAFLPG
jgi:TetR/AcrR family transcriptional regulator, transcriptional repressor of aconitase